jgi:hypothetical protein
MTCYLITSLKGRLARRLFFIFLALRINVPSFSLSRPPPAGESLERGRRGEFRFVPHTESRMNRSESGED